MRDALGPSGVLRVKTKDGGEGDFAAPCWQGRCCSAPSTCERLPRQVLHHLGERLWTSTWTTVLPRSRVGCVFAVQCRLGTLQALNNDTSAEESSFVGRKQDTSRGQPTKHIHARPSQHHRCHELARSARVYSRDSLFARGSSTNVSICTT